MDGGPVDGGPADDVSAGVIPRRDDISVEDFVREYLVPNLPVVLGPRFTDDWPARRLWVADGRPDFVRLASLYGGAQVPVTHCGAVDTPDQQCGEMEFGKFVDQWRRDPRSGLYCKDWHFALDREAPQVYSPPSPMSNDWINVFHDHGGLEGRDDYRFCYMGGGSTWTPFHEDVFRSYSWSTNICGEKYWILVPPGQTDLFTDPVRGWVHNIADPDEVCFPHARRVRRIEFVQGPGETVFVPSGWWHQVRNIGDTISINHNWANEHNLCHLYRRLAADMARVRHALRDVADMDDFVEHAQRVLRADSGSDYLGFTRFVLHMANIYLRQLADPGSISPELRDLDPYFRAEVSLRRALRLIDDVLELLAADPAARELDPIPADVARMRARIASQIGDA
ncbi:hypothetical protein LPJ61_001772 [Coemansia biformis]|uniref:JmjC domain-containing protein n=1 Tax=Coemansia biformis TaxID=1286918 RepID=A0A9W7YH23_9FUNG|nr:hypothetical protein LPJ61_001772 [Coemansia biformis]